MLLDYKMDFCSLVYYFGLLCIGGGVIFLIPLISLFFFPNEYFLAFVFLIIGLIFLIIGLILSRRYKEKCRGELKAEEAYLLIVLFWLVIVLAGSIPFVFEKVFFINALFESMSGFSTTGLSVLDVNSIPKILLFWRSLAQFVGGVGFVVLVFSAIVTPVDYLLYNTEGRTDLLVEDVTDTMKLIIKIYLIYFVLGALSYWIAGMSLFDAINHSMTAISTGGFSTRTESIAYWGTLPIEVITIILMLLGTTNFVIHYNLFKKKVGILFKHTEIKFTIIAITLITILLIITDGLNVRDSLFQTVTALSSAGLSTVDITNWLETGKFYLIILMLIGGGYGATAGGLKQLRVITILKLMVWGIKQRVSLAKTEHVITININGKVEKLTSKYIKKTFSLIVIYFVTYIVGVLIFLMHGYNLTDSLFEFASTISTIGLSVGITGPDTSIIIKMTQILGMWLGRLEFFTIIIGFSVLYKFIIKKNNN